MSDSTIVQPGMAVGISSPASSNRTDAASAAMKKPTMPTIQPIAPDVCRSIRSPNRTGRTRIASPNALATTSGTGAGRVITRQWMDRDTMSTVTGRPAVVMIPITPRYGGSVATSTTVADRRRRRQRDHRARPLDGPVQPSPAGPARADPVDQDAPDGQRHSDPELDPAYRPVVDHPVQR